MNKEEQKYLIALGNLQNMAIDNTKGSKAVEICTNDIRTYVSRLNNIIDKAIEYNYTLQEKYCHRALFNEKLASEVYKTADKNIRILQGSDKE